ncbi:MAG: SlyX family protein [Planctomycetota bacterium]
MSDNNSDGHTAEDRLERIEIALAHVQQDIESLNTSLLIHFRRLQEFELRFQRIEHELAGADEPVERRDPHIEKPPHY